MLTISRAAATILGAIVLLAVHASAQGVSPTISFDPSNNITTVRVALAVSSGLELRFNRRFSGRTPTEVAGWIGFAFGNNTESGTHDLVLSIDSAHRNLRFPDYSSFQLPRELLNQIAMAGSVEGSWDAVRFAISEPQREGIRRFLTAIDPANIAELDQPRVEHWSIAGTIDYLNAILGASPVSPCGLTRLDAQGGVLHVYVRRCDHDFDDSDMFAPASRLQQRGLLFVNGSISLDCSARVSCAETRRRSSANEEWRSDSNTWTWLKVEMGQSSAEAGEKVRNAIEYLVMLLKAQ